MTAFATQRSTLGPHELVELQDNERGRRVRVARHGATVLNLEVTTANGKVHDLADGYRDAAELDKRSGSRFAIMLPFANRIADARYRFDGHAQDLQPGVPGAQRASRHGFVRDVDFAIAELVADAQGAHATMSASIRADEHPGYPHALDLAVRYSLQSDGLALEVRMRNIGDEAAPCFFGWHPYFRLGDTPVDSWELRIPAAITISVDADSIPLPGDAANVSLDQAPILDFRRSRAIGAVKLDNGYAGLKPDTDGRIRTHMRDPASGIGVAMWQERGAVQAFSADTASRDARRAVALEPMESYADAFNRPDCAQAIRLQPGAERIFRCGVEFLLP